LFHSYILGSESLPADETWLRLMALFRRLVFIGFVACAVPWAQPQAKLPPPLPSGPISPSDSAIQSGSAPQSGPVTVKKKTQKPSSVSNVRSKLATGAVPGESPGLCFQPGIGWQRVPQNSVDFTHKTSPVGGSTSTTEVGASSSGMSQVSQDQCAGIMANGSARGAVVENIVAGKQSPAADSNIRTTNANFGVQNWLDADTLLNPASTSAATRLTMGLRPSLADSKHFSQGTGPSSSANSVQEFEAHAYISPIKLRKMMRSAPDLETRLKLRKLSEKQKGKSGVSTDNRLSLKNKTSQAMRSNASTNTSFGSHTDQ
jgi:hypothetical protein